MWTGGEILHAECHDQIEEEHPVVVNRRRGIPATLFYSQQDGGWSTPAMVDHYTKVQQCVLKDAVDVIP